MKKIITLVCVLAMTFCMSMSVFADNVISPQSTPVATEGTDEDTAPQTGDNWLIYMGAGVIIAAGVAAVAAKKLIRD